MTAITLGVAAMAVCAVAAVTATGKGVADDGQTTQQGQLGPIHTLYFDLDAANAARALT